MLRDLGAIVLAVLGIGAFFADSHVVSAIFLSMAINVFVRSSPVVTIMTTDQKLPNKEGQ